MDPFIALLLFAVLLTGETLASHFFVPAYFQFGIPVYMSSGSLKEHQDRNEWSNHLNQVFQGNPVHPSIKFRPVLTDTLAAREAIFENRAGGRYLPVMHLTIRFNSSRAKFTLTGYLNWSILAAAVYMVYRTLDERSFLPVAILVSLLFVVSYSLQTGLYHRVVQVLKGDTLA